MSTAIQPPPSCDVYTPAPLAKAIVKSLGDYPRALWLEPCVGTGAFLNALSASGVDARRITGTDLNPKSEPADKLAKVKRATEFLSWAIETDARYDRIVANPPFIALSSLSAEIQQSAERHQTLEGTALTRGGNCWYAFFCASLRLLRSGGSLAFVLPAAFEYANYSRSLREQLPLHFRDVIVHRCRTPLFQEVEDGSVVVVARRFKSAAKSKKRFVYDDLPQLVQGLAKDGKRGENLRYTGSVKCNDQVQLSDVMSISIGGVTGDAKYFLMNETQRVELGLPIDAMHPVLSKSHHVYRDTITRRQWQSLLNMDERMWLFRPESRVMRRKAVRRYLELPSTEGGCSRTGYKISKRSPWYLTPLPKSPHGFLTGMSQHGPAICLNRMRNLTATNTLYTVRFLNAMSLVERTRWAMMLLTTPVREQLNQLSRAYPLGLSKIEPGDLQLIRLPRPSHRVSSLTVYAAAVDALTRGNTRKSRNLADSWIGNK